VSIPEPMRDQLRQQQAGQVLSHDDLVTDYLALAECVHGLHGRVAMLEARVWELERKHAAEAAGRDGV